MVTDPTLSEFLAAHCGGTLDREAGAALAALAQDVAYHEKPGTLTVTIRVERKGSRVLVAGHHSAKPPKGDPEAALYFVAPDGLTRDDPHQMTLDTRPEGDPR